MPKGIYPRTEYHKNRCGFQKGHKINLGKPSPTLGMKWSDEQKLNLSNVMSGHTVSQETREKIRQAHFGIKPNEATREKLISSHLGQKSWNKGKKMPKEVKERMRRTKLGDKLYEERKRLGLLECIKVWDNFYPREFIKIRKDVYKRDNWSCQICGCKCNSSQKNNRLEKSGR